MDTKRLKSTFDLLVSERTNIESVWNTINTYVVPFRGDFLSDTDSEQSVNWHENRNIYDSTAMNSANILASSIHGALTSPATRWFDIVFKKDELNRETEAMAWLDECSSAVYQALQDSNFNLEANETYLDLVTYGSSIIVEEEHEDNGEYAGLLFQSIPVEEGFFVQGFRDQIVEFYRRYKWTPVQIRDKFPDIELPKQIQDALETDQGKTQKISVIFAVYERPEKRSNRNSGKKLAPKERPFGFKYFIHESADDIGEEGGYYEMPAFIPRWRKTNKSMWGNSPAMMALPDILTLNRLVELILKSTEKVVDPATLVTERGLLSDLDLNAGGKTVVRTMDDISSYESKARFDVSQLQRENLITAIRQAFYVDQLELKQSPAMTATEVQVRYELMQRLLGPTLGRLESDYLDPLVQRTFNILHRAGKLPPVPEVVRSAQAELDVTYIGPLARAQKADLATSIGRWADRLAAMSEIKQELLDIPDWDGIARELGALEGVPPRLMKSASVVKKERDARNKAQQPAVDAANKMAEGKAMEQMGKGMAQMQEVDNNAQYQ